MRPTLELKQTEWAAALPDIATGRDRQPALEGVQYLPENVSTSVGVQSMNWDDVRVFLAVVRHGNILVAAERLHRKHTTVARRIASLEASLGTKLLHRSTDGTRLTGDGERFLKHAKLMESASLAATAAVRPSLEIEVERVGGPDEFSVPYLALCLDH